ncbi:MAG TPA: ATP-binding protein [Allosphingosinicella sp.]|jgi:two-component system phosphate regulon sensor histidine kinase PhoR
MTGTGRGRILLALLVALTGCAVAAAIEVPLLAGLAGLVAGALGAAILGGAFLTPQVASAEEPSRADPEALAREVMDALGEPMLLLDGGRIGIANAAARALLGEWVEGQDVRLALRHPTAVEQLGRQASQDAQGMEIMGVGAEAERRWLMTVAPLEGGMRLVHLSDRSEAAAAERMRVDFVANASHELRTPLATLLGFIETLRDDEAAEDRELRGRFLGIMNDEARRMQQLIDDLMSLSRVEADRFRAPRDAVDLVPLVEEVRGGCAHLLAERGNSLAVDDRSGGAVVPGDRGQLLQLVRNLVVNAVKYGRPGTAIRVAIENAGESVSLSVADQGDGIAPEHLPRLTERFYRVDAGRSRAEGGTGLGLAICKHIVGRHRGRLDIASQIGEGTTVKVTLPRLSDAG